MIARVSRRKRQNGPRRKSGPQPGTPSAAYLFIGPPALYAALLVAGVYAGPTVSPTALAVLAGFTGYMAWRLYLLYAGKEEEERDRGLGGVEAVEVGFLALLALGTLHQVAPAIGPWWGVTHSVLLVMLGSFVRLPELLVLPLIAVGIGAGVGGWLTAPWLLELGRLELIGLAAGATFAMERAKVARLQKTVKRARLEADHLHAQRGPAPGQSTSLSAVNETLYNYLEEIRQNTGAHSAVLAVRARDGSLYVREMASDSDRVREDAGLQLTGNAFKWVVERQKHLLIGRLAEPDKALGYYQGRVAIQSFLGVPILTGGEVDGVLAVDALEPNAFGEDKVTVLKVATHQVAALLQQVRQLEEVRREARDFKLLHEFSKELTLSSDPDELSALTLAVVEERLGPQFAAMALVDEVAGTIVIQKTAGSRAQAELEGAVITAEEGLTGWALQTGQYLPYDGTKSAPKRPVFGPDVANPPFRSLLIHPFSRQEEPLGALVLAFDNPGGFDAAGIAFCDILCQQVALGLLQIRSLMQLRQMATLDPLTGLANRRLFFHELGEEIKRARRYETPISMLLLDLDHFKKINDVYGHPAGDEVLRRVAATLTHHARETDVVARVGGEEFAALLPQTDEEGAARMAERFRVAVGQLQVPWESMTIRLSISCGVAQFEEEVEGPEELVDRADKCLYTSKEDGRNRVTLFRDIREYVNWSKEGED